MAEITAAMVKDLRERTGAGMMDCKNALVEASGDVAQAMEVLQKKGKAKAAKAGGKIAADGMVLSQVSSDGTQGVLVEVNCQTDFVAKGDDFKAFANTVAQQALASGVSTVDALEALVVDGKSLRDHAEALTVRSGEKHAIRRLERFVSNGGLVTTYIHHGSRLGVLLEVAGAKGPALSKLADDVALQIASMGPRWVRRDDVPQDVISKQREIFAAQMKTEDDEIVNTYESALRQAKEEGAENQEKVVEYLKGLEKKANGVKARSAVAVEKILDGKVAKWLTEIVLVDQLSIRPEDEGKKKVSDVVAEAAKTIAGANIVRFARYELGEGVDKGEQKDFAAEVAEMAAKAAQ